MACFAGGHVVVEVMSFIRICVMGGNVLQVDISCGKSSSIEDMSYETLCLTGGHVLQ